MTQLRRKVDSHPTCPPSHEGKFLGDDIFGLYRHDTRKNPRLDDEKMIELVGLVQAGIAAQDQIDGDEDISQDEKAELADIAATGLAARNDIVSANTGLVFDLAQRYKNKGLDEMDLIQEGNIGLIRAVELFDPNNAKGASFGHYAYTWIRSSISKAIHRQGRSIQVPYDSSVLIQKMHTIERDFKNEHGYDVGDDVLYEEMNNGRKKKLTQKQIDELRTMAWDMDSLNREIEGSDGSLLEMGDAVSDPVQAPVEDLVAKMETVPELVDNVAKMLANSCLTLLEKDVVRLYIAEGQDMDTVAQVLNITRRKVNGTSRSAMYKLREQLAQGGELDYFRQQFSEFTQ